MTDATQTPTPGPWRVDDHPKREYPRVTDARGKFVADCNTEADAHLIAAAPDMLACLDAVAAAWGTLPFTAPLGLKALIDAARAKARGVGHD